MVCNFIEITLRHGCSPVNLLHDFRKPFTKNTSGRLFLYRVKKIFFFQRMNNEENSIYCYLLHYWSGRPTVELKANIYEDTWKRLLGDKNSYPEKILKSLSAEVIF